MVSLRTKNQFQGVSEAAERFKGLRSRGGKKKGLESGNGNWATFGGDKGERN